MKALGLRRNCSPSSHSWKSIWTCFCVDTFSFQSFIILYWKYDFLTEKFNGSPNKSKSTVINWWLRSSKRWLISVSIEKSFSSKKCDYLQEREFEWFQLRKKRFRKRPERFWKMDSEKLRKLSKFDGLVKISGIHGLHSFIC